MKCIALFLIIIMFSSCAIKPEKPGGLHIIISLKNANNHPQFDPTYYYVTGDGPHGMSENCTIKIKEHTIDEIIPGKWIFSIQAYDTNEKLIGFGRKSVIIIPEAMSEITIVVNQIPEITPATTLDPIPESTPQPTITGTPSITHFPTSTTHPGVHIGETQCAYLDITRETLYNVSHTMEYSLDGKESWIQCNGSIQSITLHSGAEVWVRQINDESTHVYLGHVQALSGTDLIPGKAFAGTGNWTDSPYGSPGEIRGVRTYFTNMGDRECDSSSHHFQYYLSTDTTITGEDTLLVDYLYTSYCLAGETKFVGTNFIVPHVTPGIYYIGCILDTTHTITEINENNNTTRPCDVAEFIVKNPTILDDGAFKIVNSWGIGDWENKDDGHYWVTYGTIKHQEMRICYYYNDFSHIYKPKVVAVFQLTHPYRDECLVTLGLGDPDNPYMKKDLNPGWNSTSESGHQPFPDNKIVIDISEFAMAINDLDLYLTVMNTQATQGTIDNFSVEFYSDYNSTPFSVITGETSSFSGSTVTSVKTETKGSLTNTQVEMIQPLSRKQTNSTTFIETKPTFRELKKDMESAGVYNPTENYKIIVKDKFTTGEKPLTTEEWNNVKKLKHIENSITRAGLPLSIDHSRTPFFPPIGNQGRKGSCVAFSIGYYIQTFTEAKEHAWDLSTTRWTGIDPHLQSNAGAPENNRDKIFSPDFLYHQLNSGVDEGSNAQLTAALIIRIGNCSWTNMPYNTSHYTKWPEEKAWREAGKYRGREVSNHYWDNHRNGYFIVYNDADIELLKNLLASGYCVSTSVKGDSGGIYDLLNPQDVVDNDTVPKMATNHANTIVGYKEGSAWDFSNPDN